MIEKYQPLVSVIIPVYNVISYIDKCIQSVINQTYKNLEIILVDDGSTDGSGKRCDEYAFQDNRIKVIHKKNGGLSDARNYGISNMSGEFVTFVDSDDWLDFNFIDQLMKIALSKKSDIVTCMGKKTIIENVKINQYNCTGSVDIYGSDEAILKLLYRKIPAYAWGKIYKSCLFENVAYPVGKLFEDTITTYNLFKIANEISVLNVELYFYRQRQSSIVNINWNPTRLDSIYHAFAILNDVTNMEEKEAATGFLFFELLDNYSLIKNNYPEEKSFLEKMIKKYRHTVFKNRDESISMRFMALLTYFPTLKIVKIAGSAYNSVKVYKWRK